MENTKALKEYGVNALWFHGFNEVAFTECSRSGLAACVEFKTFRADFGKHPELIPIGMDGKPIRYGYRVQGVCLSNQEFLQKTESSLLEGLKKFKPRGIWLDYLTYAGWFETSDPDLQESCFCPACIEAFCTDTGVDESNPALIIQQYAREWALHKCRKIAGYAKHYAALIRAYDPECIVGAYMCPWTPREFDGALTRVFAQDYSLLSSFIDVFTPLIYAKKSGRSAEWGKEFLETCRTFIPSDNKVQLILDYLDFPDSLLATTLSQMPSWGFQMFGGISVFKQSQQADIFREAVAQVHSMWKAK